MSEYRDLEVFDDVVIEVYLDGRIKTKDHSYRIKSNGLPDNRKGKFLRPGTDPDGYLKVTLTRNGVRKCYPVHRLVAMAWIPNPDEKPTVNHIDGNKKNNKVDNLEWATHREQKLHSIETGLSEKNVEYLADANRKRSRKVLFNGNMYESIREAARKENVSRTLIKSKGVFV